MPVLECTNEITPKSVLRHRPIGESKSLPGRHSIVTSATMPVIPTVPRASRSRLAGSHEEATRWKRQDEEQAISGLPSTHLPAARRSSLSPKPQSATRAVRSIPTTSRPRSLHPKLQVTTLQTPRQMHPLLYLGVGMLAMIMLWTTASAIIGWTTTTLDDLHYGRPRTYQTDQWVGHNEQNGILSHFIAVNLKGHIEVIEFPGGDASHAKVYLGPQLYGANDNLVPVTLTFADINGDHKLDMIINVQGSQVVFINDQETFRPLQPSERHEVEQKLQHLR